MTLKDTIKYDIINYFISELNKDILKNTNHIQYGLFSYDYNIDYNKNDQLGNITIRMEDKNSTYKSTVFKVNVCKNKITGFWFWKNELTDEQKIENELYDLFMRRNAAKIRQAEIDENEKLLSGLPKEKRKNFMREQKLERIVGDEK